MVMTNQFKDSTEARCHGVLIQAGKFDGLTDGFHSLEIVQKKATTSWATGKFKWANIYRGKSPIDSTYARYLYPDSGVTTGCDDATATDYRCLRNRVLHGGMAHAGAVHAIVTFWPEDDYRMDSFESSEHAGHQSYLFAAKNQYTVEIYTEHADKSLALDTTYHNVSQVILHVEGPPTHGDHIEPSWPGFGTP
jgi:hypothetical protein